MRFQLNFWQMHGPSLRDISWHSRRINAIAFAFSLLLLPISNCSLSPSQHTSLLS